MDTSLEQSLSRVESQPGDIVGDSTRGFVGDMATLSFDMADIVVLPDSFLLKEEVFSSPLDFTLDGLPTTFRASLPPETKTFFQESSSVQQHIPPFVSTDIQTSPTKVSRSFGSDDRNAGTVFANPAAGMPPEVYHSSHAGVPSADAFGPRFYDKNRTGYRKTNAGPRDGK